jgi:hypothetical protein
MGASLLVEGQNMNLRAEDLTVAIDELRAIRNEVETLVAALILEQGGECAVYDKTLEQARWYRVMTKPDPDNRRVLYRVDLKIDPGMHT